VDYLALTGDAVDNIPGVPGVGPKTAAQLLANFDSLDALYARIEEVPYLRLRGAGQVYARLKEHRAQAMLSRTLAGIVLDAPVPAHPSALARASADAQTLDALLETLRFGPLTRTRCKALLAG
jgi:5'-3' exonuclease